MEKNELDALLKESHEGSRRSVEFAAGAMVLLGLAGVALAICALKFGWF